MNSKKGNWFITASGEIADIEYPRRTVLLLYDIARSLSMQCRFNGHVSSFYSVAQHSVHVSRLVTQRYAREALLHDASEAYLGDVIRPLKELLVNYGYLESRWDGYICSDFDLQQGPVCSAAVKEADRIALVTERKYLVCCPSLPNIPWREDELGYAPDEVYWLDPLLPAEAERLFVDRCVELRLATSSWLEPGGA
jgi:hypothetical protein